MKFWTFDVGVVTPLMLASLFSSWNHKLHDSQTVGWPHWQDMEPLHVGHGWSAEKYEWITFLNKNSKQFANAIRLSFMKLEASLDILLLLIIDKNCGLWEVNWEVRGACQKITENHCVKSFRVFLSKHIFTHCPHQNKFYTSNETKWTPSAAGIQNDWCTLVSV